MAEAIANTYTPPKWLNQKFLQDALKEGLRRGSIQLSDYKIRPATNKGDNYVSQMFRISAKIASRKKDEEAMSLVIKSLPLGEGAEKFVEDSKFFVREIKMLSETLPVMQKILDEAGRGLPKLCADVYYHQGPPKDLLILEDLCLAGFRPATNRLEGLDLRHSVLVVESLATLHATSLEAIRRYPDIKETYGEIWWSRKYSHILNKMVFEGIDCLADVIEDWEDVPRGFSEKLRLMKTTLLEKGLDASEGNENDFRVLNHGDPWTNNFMLKYENETPVALKFVDFQVSSYNSPVADLHYFIFTSPQEYVRRDHLNLLLESYHRRLEDVCEKLEYPLQFSLGDLRGAFFEKIAFGFLISITIFPITRSPNDGVNDLNDLASDDGIGMDPKLFRTDTFKNGMKSMLPFFIDNGLFD